MPETDQPHPPAPPTDAVAQLRTELALAQEQIRLLNAALDAVPDMVLMKGPQSRIVYANRAFRDYYGMSQEQLRDLIDAPFNEPDYTQQYIRDDAKVFQSGETLDIPSEPVTRYDGEIRLFHTIKSAIRDAGGAVTHTVGISRDITAQGQLTIQQQTFRAMVERSPDAIISVVDGAIAYANPASQSLFGYSEDEWPSVSLEALHAPAARPMIAEIVTHLEREEVWRGELAYLRSDGASFLGEASIFPLRLGESAGGSTTYVGIIRDVTAQKQAEAERLALQEQIIEAQQVSLRELSTPLLPVSDTVVVMPLVGTIDSRRAIQIMEVLLEGVAANRAETVLIDISGVRVVDTQVADALLRAARAVKLLGSQVILTGISAEVAQTIVQLGADLSGVSTQATMQAGLRSALAGARR